MSPQEKAPFQLNRICYGLTIFVGAYLMFQIQPLVGKIVTPQFGGTAAIWSLCMMFFQLSLLGGYFLTFTLSQQPPKIQAIAYMICMVASAFFIHIPLGSAWSPSSDTDPVWSLLQMMVIYLAAPAILLSTVSGLIQNWYRLCGYGDPYPLYSLSNIGSLGALLIYPLLIEPNFSVSETLDYWQYGYYLLVALTLVAAINLLNQQPVEKASSSTSPSTEIISQEENHLVNPAPSQKDYAWWIGLSAGSSILLLSLTAYITHDIAPIPLLWVIPLCLYLFTFILCFGKNTLYHRQTYITLSQVFVILSLFCQFTLGLMFAYSLGLLFCFCMVCHGELIASKPDGRYLTRFYLALAIGGALGGVFVNLIAPLIFDSNLEYFIILFVLFYLTLFISGKHHLRFFSHSKYHGATMFLLIGLLFGKLILTNGTTTAIVLHKERNFYGAQAIMADKAHKLIKMVNGVTCHGYQSTDPAFQNTPTGYYYQESAIGLVESIFRHGPIKDTAHPLKVGIVGLGAGTIATYGKPGESYIYYEIDPKVTRSAQTEFSFLKNAQAKTEIRMGDARTTLEHEAPQHYDLLVIDAFNSDAIPIHLLTKEAFQLYFRHLNPNGILMVHCSNRFLNLHSVVGTLGKYFGYQPIQIGSKPVPPLQELKEPAMYVVLTKNKLFFEALHDPNFKSQHTNLVVRNLSKEPEQSVWTDDYSNIISIIRPEDYSSIWKAVQKVFDSI
ncbi:MAG: fused MFS/spermidine synthase [Cyanobacteria bacterium]|nr:fused MFS/spermidine synthase [Cyanobacteriota bacterium]